LKKKKKKRILLNGMPSATVFIYIYICFGVFLNLNLTFLIKRGEG
jgi:hypothetical protein